MIASWTPSFRKFYEWLRKHKKVNLIEYQKKNKNKNYAILAVQSDNRNHLTIRVRGKMVYVRVTLRELAELLRGDASFAESPSYEDEYKKICKEIAEKIKDVEEWVIITYLEGNGVIAKRFEVTENSILIETTDGEIFRVG